MNVGQLEGRLYVWRFAQPGRDWKGWHLSADADACQGIAALADEMLATEWSVRRRVPVSVPERMLVGAGRSWEPVVALVLQHDVDASDDFWSAAVSDGPVLTLTVGRAKLTALRDALLGLPHWKDDFALGPETRERGRWESECLWFWTRVE